MAIFARKRVRFWPSCEAAGYLRGEKYSNYGMERFCNKTPSLPSWAILRAVELHDPISEPDGKR